MIKLRILILLVLSCLLVIQSTDIELLAKKSLKHALFKSIYQPDEDLDLLQRCQKCFWKRYCKNCYAKSDDYDEEIPMIQNLYDEESPMIQNLLISRQDEPLSANELKHLTTPLEDTTKNKNSDLNTTCISCLELYEKQYLNQYNHNDGSAPHYSNCYRCEIDYVNQYSGTICASCRKPSSKRSSQYVRIKRFTPAPAARIFDGSSLSTVISSLTMTILSFLIVRNMENVNDSLVGENNFEEITQSKLFSLLNMQVVTGFTWLWYFAISIYFLCQKKYSTSLLIDTRGVFYLLVPIIIGFITNYNIDAGSFLTMIPTVLFVLDMYFKGGKIVSLQFQQFNREYPQIHCMQTNYDEEPQGKWFKFLAPVGRIFYYLDVMALIGLTNARFEGHDICSEIDPLLWGIQQIKSTHTLLPILYSALLCSCLLMKIGWDFYYRRPRFNFREGFMFFFSMIAIFSSEIQCGAFAINLIVSDIVEVSGGLFFLWCFCACLFGDRD